jgi:putative restriction endonuclease
MACTGQAGMTLSPIQRNYLDYALRMNGYHAECEVEGDWVAADATFAPGRCFLSYRLVGGNDVIVAMSLAHVARAFAEEGGGVANGVALPVGAVAAFLTDVAGLHATVRRIFELSRSLPSAPLGRFLDRIRSLPQTTEAERLVIQRIGQEVFRDSLMEYWGGRCPLTGITDPALLRASHIVPWAECSDEQRLDVHNGLLLSALWDAAFDKGLVSFADDGTPLPSPLLSKKARMTLGIDTAPALAGLREPHRANLTLHRARHRF